MGKNCVLIINETQKCAEKKLFRIKIQNLKRILKQNRKICVGIFFYQLKYIYKI